MILPSESTIYNYCAVCLYMVSTYLYLVNYRRLTHSHQNHVIFLYDTSESRKEKKQGGGGLGGKGTWNDLDDGSMDN